MNNKETILQPLIGSAREGLDAILIICGLVGIPVNILLIMATITAYSPSATPAA